jgi:hypothetical protein
MSDIPDPTARLESLGGMTQDFEQDNPTPEQAQARASQQQAAAVAADGARDWGMLMFTIGGLVTMIAPELQPIYSEQRCLTWGQHMNLVSMKHGWGSPDNMPEFALAAATISIAVPTYLVVSAKVTEAKAAKKSIMGSLFYWWKHRKGAKTEKEGQVNGSEP